MDTKLLKKWRAEANKLFFKDLSIVFTNLMQFNIPKFTIWKDCDGYAKSIKGVDWITFFEDERIYVKDLKSKLQKSYKDFVDGYVEYRILKTKERHPYRSFRIKFFKIKRR